MHLLSSFTDDIGLRREPKGSALPKFPSSVSDGGWFRGYTGSLLRCGLSSCSPPCTDLTRNFPRPTGTFTPELPASRSPFSSSGITTVATERFHRWDFHPLECQLASLHRLFHPLHSCRLSGKAMARTGLRMLPTFPSPPLKFRTASFPRYGFKAGISDKAFPKKLGLPSSFVPTAFTVYSLLCVRDDARVRHLRASGPNRSTPGALAPVRVMLSRSIIT